MKEVHARYLEYGVMFKINYVINAYNVNEDMSENIMQLEPMRWKIFQCKKRDG